MAGGGGAAAVGTGPEMGGGAACLGSAFLRESRPMGTAAGGGGGGGGAGGGEAAGPWGRAAGLVRRPGMRDEGGEATPSS